MEKDKWFYKGTAHSTKYTGSACIVMAAVDLEEAKTRYKECINRHEHLRATESSKIGILWNSQQMFDDLFDEEMLEELNAYGSVCV